MIDLNWAASFLPLTGAGFGVGFLVGLTGVGRKYVPDGDEHRRHHRPDHKAVEPENRDTA
jgi:hypothetical protein